GGDTRSDESGRHHEGERDVSAHRSFQIAEHTIARRFAGEIVGARSVSDYLTPPENAKAQPSLGETRASYGLAGAKAAKKTREESADNDPGASGAAQNINRRGG